MKDLHIGHGFRFPLDAATQTLLIVGKRGSGKSTTATRFAEQLIDARVPVAVIDPVDVWWGLKAGADGGAAGGKQVYIFGGRHADLPLEPTAGELVDRTGASPRSSQFKPSLATLRRNGLITQEGDQVRLSEELFGVGVR